MRTGPRRLLTFGVVALLAFGGCAKNPEADSSAAGRTQPAAATALRASFDELAAAIPATIGIALAPVGSVTVYAFGSWPTGVAWSTIKVPLAIAGLRAGESGTQALVTAAITKSDNAAAEQLWSQLGPPAQAAQRVQAVLREGGDPLTVVESRRLRPGFTAFGQTRWSLRLQAQFAAHLPCLAGAGSVVDLMQHLVPGQRWGLSASGGAAKGGWGPGAPDGYLVRQFGIVTTAAGQLGVALAAEPHAGTFDAGVDALNRMAAWLTAHTAELPGGNCPG